MRASGASRALVPTSMPVANRQGGEASIAVALCYPLDDATESR